MANWVDKKSAELESQKAELDRRHVCGAETVDKLEMAVRRDIERWNELNPAYRRRIDGVRKLMHSGAFRVYKTSFPPAMVDAMLDPESFQVLVEITTTRPGEKRPHTEHGHFELSKAAEGFALTLKSGYSLSFADASQVLLGPIIESIG
jgi:hypothetical protein